MRALLRPTLRVETLRDVNLRLLRQRGIRCLILDLDNTLVPWGGVKPQAAALAWLTEAKRRGFRAVILSNNGAARVRAAAAALGVPYIPLARKPLAYAYRKAMKLMGGTPKDTAVIGDQLFTDILGGNRLGLMTILVRPLADEEFIGTRLLRHAERIVLRRLDVAGASAASEGRRVDGGLVGP